MSFDRFLLAVESRDPSQADKSVFFSILQDFNLSFKNLQLHQKDCLALDNLAKLMLWSILSFKNLQD